jgi:SAM-dependent methyltransferase
MPCPACGFEERDCRVAETFQVAVDDAPAACRFLECGRCATQFAPQARPAPPRWYADRGEFYGWRWEFNQFLEDLKERSPAGERMRVLEVGCGEGIVLERLHRQHEAWGLDFNAEAASVGRRKGLRISSLPLEEFRASEPDLRFDAAAFFHIIEHLERPVEFLGRIRGLLAPGGLAFLSVPNPGRYTLKVRREAWDYPPHHLTRFSKTGICRLLERAGFEVLKTLDEPVGDRLVRLAKKEKFKKVPLPKVLREALKAPIFALLYPFGERVRRSSAGISFYIMARSCGE